MKGGNNGDSYGKDGNYPKAWNNRKVVGVYIGWRGESIDIRGVNNLTYWDRKAVAEQVGRGGVTEFLLKLEKALRNPETELNKNVFLVTGHSFGGAVVLSALHEVMFRTCNLCRQKDQWVL